MTSDPRRYGTLDRRVVLSTVWVFTLFNYLYTDLASLFFNEAGIRSVAANMSPAVVLGWTVFLETAIAMILLSRILPYGANRWANISIAALQMVGLGSILIGGIPPAYYVFTGVIEMASFVFIIGYAWTWKPEHVPAHAA